MAGACSARSRAEARARPVRSALAARRFVEASRLIDEWTAAAPRDGAAEYHRAWLDVLTNHPVEAMDAMRRALDKGHPMGPPTTLRAVLLAQAGRVEEAEPTLRAAFEAREEPIPQVAEGLARIELARFRLAEVSRPLEALDGARPVRSPTVPDAEPA